MPKTHRPLRAAKTLLQIALLLTMLVVFIFVAMSVLNRNADVNAEVAMVQEQIDAEAARGLEIEHQAGHQHSRSFIEDIARRRLNLAYPDEIIFIMVD